MKGRDRVDTLIAMSLGVSKYAHGFFEIPSGKIENDRSTEFEKGFVGKLQ